MPGPFPGPTPRPIGRLRPGTAPVHHAGSGGHGGGHSRDPGPRRGAVPGGASGGRSVSPVLDCSKTTGFSHLVNHGMFCDDTMSPQVSAMITGPAFSPRKIGDHRAAGGLRTRAR
ncbi:hypothetical protein GCM10009546_74440 [Actinomadura livida]|uniref:Uncharacterized protein n=1 Tax=Actinomadura livida TaxID=79909 RepID=A0ABP3R2A4_9ACTN|nr:hypothetical protein GCM10010208_11130 [Actinomadura livida]